MQAQGIPMIPTIPTIDYLNTTDPTWFFYLFITPFYGKSSRMFNFLSFYGKNFRAEETNIFRSIKEKFET